MPHVRCGLRSAPDCSNLTDFSVHSSYPQINLPQFKILADRVLNSTLQQLLQLRGTSPSKRNDCICDTCLVIQFGYLVETSPFKRATEQQPHNGSLE